MANGNEMRIYSATIRARMATNNAISARRDGRNGDALAWTAHAESARFVIARIRNEMASA